MTTTGCACQGHAHAHATIEKRARPRVRPGSLAVANHRVLVAAAWIPRMAAQVVRPLAMEVNEAALRVKRDADPVTRGMLPRWSAQLYTAMRPAVYAATDTAREITDREFSAMRSAARRKANGPLAQRELEAWLKRTATSATRTHARMIARLTLTAQEEGLNLSELARMLEEEGLANSSSHAHTIARTNSMWSSNQGAVMSYRDAGITHMQWFTTHDDRVCPACQSMDGQIVPLDGAFAERGSAVGPEGSEMEMSNDIEHPPLHPNCGCTLMPVLNLPSLESAFGEG